MNEVASVSVTVSGEWRQAAEAVEDTNTLRAAWVRPRILQPPVDTSVCVLQVVIGADAEAPTVDHDRFKRGARGSIFKRS